jgi:hypothetical protein
VFGVYRSLSALYWAEMRVLLWLAVAALAATLSYGIFLYHNFRRQRRRLGWTGIHLSLAVGTWFVWLFSWYFWVHGARYWRGRVAPWHYAAFLGAGLLLAAVSALGLAVHHLPFKPRRTPRLVLSHWMLAAAAACLWVAGAFAYH